MIKIPIQCTEEQLDFIVKCIAENGLNFEIANSKFSFEVHDRDEVKSIFIRADPPPRWRAEKGGEYFFVDEYAEAESAHEDLDWVDDGLYDTGNYFRTREQAESVAAKVRELFEGNL